MAHGFQSIAMQVAEALRADIASGAMNRGLPGERALAARFRVSRKTVRKGLLQLRAEGVVHTQAARGSSVARRRSSRVKSDPHVALLLPEPIERARPFTAIWVNHLMSRLQEIGHPLRIFHGTRYYGNNASRPLARLTKENPAQCWIIARSNRPLQGWFAASGIATLVAGSALPGIDLASVDVDHRAQCRHSAALFLRRGHRRLALFLDRGGHGGDAESEQGFREGLAAAHDPIQPVVCSPKSTPSAVIREIRRLLALQTPPTGLLVSNSYSYLTVSTYLASKGLRVPQDMSIVCRDEENFLRVMCPMPTFYTISPIKFAKEMHRALKRLLAGERHPFCIRIMPTLVEGQSVGAGG